MSIKRAFTLIELLVVIAIIAILAAILFPVFAQAKVAAKGAASISNDKQVSTASMIYLTDYDDRPVLMAQGDGDAPLLLLGNPYKPWGYLLTPYTKNSDIYQDPLIQKEPNDLAAQGVPDSLIWQYRTQYGYAFTIHSPTLPSGSTWVTTPTVQTALAQPAETVMFVMKKSRNSNPDWLWVGSLIWGANLVNPPVLNFTDTPVGVVNPHSYVVPYGCWGTGCTAYSTQSEEEGSLTGGVALRKAKKSIVAMSDGHVKVMSAGAMAAGTDWSPTKAGYTVKLTDKGRYLWDMD